MTEKRRLICIIRTEDEVAAFDEAAADNDALWADGFHVDRRYA